MLIITSSKSATNFGNVETSGVSLTAAAKPSYYREVLAGGPCALAYVSNSAFAAMKERGDAVDEPPLTTVDRSGQIRMLGGSKVYRCDFELRENGLWLVPEAAKNNGVLFFLQRDDSMTEGSSVEISDGMRILASRKDDYSKNSWDLISLEPGASFKITTYGTRRVKPMGLANWFGEDQWERCAAWEQTISLSADGTELAL